ncbi:MAG: MTAP family purine nucleoside phosphorylase [Candidatus Saliniplasma sp.]
MKKIGVIGGTSFKDWDGFEIEEEIESHTPWGTPSSPLLEGMINGVQVFLLLRHGRNHDIPPHKINHRANIYALQREVRNIIGISSAGALKDDIEVPTISIPSDYVNFWNVHTFYDERIKHVTPALSKAIREGLLEASQEVQIEIRDEDVYVMTKGPRLETKAEVDILKRFGDIVGMSMGPEATLCKENSIEYASITTVDNYAHGIGPEKVKYEDIVETARDNWDNITKILEAYFAGL